MKRKFVLAEIAAVVSEIHLSYPLRIAIDGRDGAGKTSLADDLVEPIRSQGRHVIRASIDSFHNPRAIRYGRGRQSPEGYFLDSFNYEMLRHLLLEPLGPCGSREYRTSAFDWRTDAPAIAPLRRSPDDAILILDGVFLLRPELMNYWEFTVFVDVSEEIGSARCAARDGSSTDPADDSNRRYVEGQNLYFCRCNPKARADIVVVNDDVLSPSLLWNRVRPFDHGAN